MNRPNDEVLIWPCHAAAGMTPLIDGFSGTIMSDPRRAQVVQSGCNNRNPVVNQSASASSTATVNCIHLKVSPAACCAFL